MRVLLVSTYELGHQPLSLAVAAGALTQAGHEVRTADLAVERWAVSDIAWADALAFSVPMHTATRLAADALDGARRVRPGIPACAFGLYAGVAGDAFDRLIAGEWQDDLIAWVAHLKRSVTGPVGPAIAQTTPAQTLTVATGGAVPSAPPVVPDLGSRITVALGRNRAPGASPARSGLPALDRYARLAVGGDERLVGYVEASRGCAHRCRHCPVPVVYDGRTRLVAVDEVVADIGSLVGLGAEHITFGDPDFLNAPHHAVAVAEAVHDRWPHLTFDITVKVEHILRHRDLLPALKAAGCLFAITAVECLDDEVLRRLDKGHTSADAADAVHLLRSAGIEPRPTWLPFTPWTSVEDLCAIVDFVAAHDLIGNVDPVQYSVRLLVPPGSLLLSDPDFVARLGPYDDRALSWTWQSPDSGVDALQQRLAQLAQQAGVEGWSQVEAFTAVRDAVDETAGRVSSSAVAAGSTEGRPRLTEPWFC